MNILGKLPAGQSPSGTIDGLDYQKTLRMGIVVIASAFLIAFGQAFRATGMDAVNWHVLLSSAFQAGIAAAGASALELVRRLFANQAI